MVEFLCNLFRREQTEQPIQSCDLRFETVDAAALAVCETPEQAVQILQYVIDDAWHDNSCNDADQADDAHDMVLCEQRCNISLHEAIICAETTEGHVTLYLYDKGFGL